MRGLDARRLKADLRALRGLSGDERNIAAANADIVELAIGQLRKLADRVAVTAPGSKLLANGLERGHGYLHL